MSRKLTKLSVPILVWTVFGFGPLISRVMARPLPIRLMILNRPVFLKLITRIPRRRFKVTIVPGRAFPVFRRPLRRRRRRRLPRRVVFKMVLVVKLRILGNLRCGHRRSSKFKRFPVTRSVLSRLSQNLLKRRILPRTLIVLLLQGLKPLRVRRRPVS